MADASEHEAPPPLRRDDLDVDPLVQVHAWLAEGRTRGADAATTMAIATVSDEGHPTVRVVPLRAIDAQGLWFFTSRDTGKGRDLARRPEAAALLTWPDRGRQIRIEGTASIADDATSAAWFAGRPPAAQARAWATRGEGIATDRADVERALHDARARHEGAVTIERPPWWSAVLLVPTHVEVFQADPTGAHDRIVYERDGDGWRRTRLHP